MFCSDELGIRGLPVLAGGGALKALMELQHLFPLGLRNGEIECEKERGPRKNAGVVLGTNPLEVFPTFIVGIELKDRMGEKYETKPQNQRSVARLLE